MRLKLWERVLVALSGLLILFVAVSALIYGIGVLPFQLDISFLNQKLELWQRAAIVVVALLLLALGIQNMHVLFRRRKDKGFIIQRTEYGDMSISMNALENMVKKCVDSHQELSVSATKIHKGREGVVVDIKIMLLSGVNIPLTVNALQKQIKQYITSCSGVDVQQVRVMVETNATAVRKGDAAAAPFVNAEIDGAAETSMPESGAYRIFSHTEEPVQVPEPAKVDLPHEETQEVEVPPVEDLQLPQETDSTLADEAPEDERLEDSIEMKIEEDMD